MSRYHILRNSVSSRWLFPSLAATVSVGFWQDTTSATTSDQSHSPSDCFEVSSNNHLSDQIDNFASKASEVSRLFTFHPNKVLMEGHDVASFSLPTPDLAPQAKTINSKDDPYPTEFDFVVVGNGNAGRQAIETLKKECPTATVAVIDPYRPYYLLDEKITYVPTTVVGFDPIHRTLCLAEDRPNLKYRQAVLIATGARGAAPPLSLFDNGALDRLLELRSTTIPKSLVRPAVGPETARHITLTAASQGAKIGILGSGWEAVELAAAITRVSGSKPPVMVQGSSGPLAHVLPRYLSAEVAARLRQQGITVLERSLVRYVQSSQVERSIPKLELHTAKSYDLLETKRTSMDLIVVAPNIQGSRGTASMPTIRYPKALKPSGKLPWYRSWSQLTGLDESDASVIACYADDGRIAVNAELCAASRVYAAGSVAKYANAVNGHALIAGEGPVDGAVAGRIAALNMSRDYHERNGLSYNFHDKPTAWSFASESLPIWRSDLCCYMSNGASPGPSILDDIGIRALCVGNCDAERLTTYGFWWTNIAAQQRMLSKRNALPIPNARPNRYPTGRRMAKPVYGVGVVYYLDDSDNVKGIMLWGLPYTTQPRAEIKRALLDHIKNLLSNNGNALRRKWDDELTHASATLAEESERIVTTALRNSNGALRTNRTLSLGVGQKLPKPLCRYTPAKTAEIATLGFLKRRDRIGTSLLGEEIYVRRDDDEDSLAPNSSVTGLRWGNLEHARTALVLHENEQKSRPPKEDPLWLRFGDANRGVSSADALAQKFYSNLYRGRLADGSDPLNPRPNTVTPAADLASSEKSITENSDVTHSDD